MSEKHDPAAGAGGKPRQPGSQLAGEDVVLGDVLANKYRLDHVLGEGGACTVFSARNLHANKQVAIKWLRREQPQHEELERRLLREAQVLSVIDHPSVLTVFDVEHHRGVPFLVMEQLQGEPLSELLARGPLPAHALISLLLPVLDGLHVAHGLGFVHRDLKPENLFVCADPSGGPGRLKLFDFGIVKLGAEQLRTSRPLTARGAVFGTPRYMAPEQMRDAQAIDLRADVYALGVLLYHALSGRFPYEGDTLGELASRLIAGPPTPLQQLVPELPSGLSYLVMRALAVLPAARFSSVQQLALALTPFAREPTHLLATLGVSTRSPSKPPALPASVRASARPPPLPPHVRRASSNGRTR